MTGNVPLDLAITGTGLVCAAGDEPFALLSAVGARLGVEHAGHGCQECQARPSAWDAQGSSHSRAVTFELGDPQMGLAWMGENALSTVLRQLPTEIPLDRVMIYMLMSGRAEAGSGSGNALDWPGLVRSALPHVGAIRCALDTAPLDDLAAVAAELWAGHWDAVLFGGLDSLVHCQDPEEVLGAQGGQAAAFAILQPAESRPKSREGCGTLREIQAPGNQPAAWPDSLSRFRAIICERQQPIDGSEIGQGPGSRAEILETLPTLGIIGAATLPVHLVLAEAFFAAQPALGQFGEPTSGAVFVQDSDSLNRGLVLEGGIPEGEFS